MTISTIYLDSDKKITETFYSRTLFGNNPIYKCYFTIAKALTWPVYFADHLDQSNVVEHANCTRGGVKSYRALLESGGRHNLLLSSRDHS